MANSNQFTKIIRISFVLVLAIALVSLASAIYLSAISSQVPQSDLEELELRSPVVRDVRTGGSKLASLKAWCVRRTARQKEVDNVIQEMETKERSTVFEKIFREDFWGGGESRSGPGSRRDYTTNVRKLVGLALKTFGVQHLLDAPCGDVNWQPLIEGFNTTNYTGFDIVPDMIRKNTERFKGWANVNFARVDFTNTAIDSIVNPDLIICRDAIQHNTLKDGLRGIANLESTGAKYLITNWHSPPRPNRDIKFGDFYLIDVFTHPFNFSQPEMIIAEGVNGYNSEGKFAGVWKLPALFKGDGKPFRIPNSLNGKVRQEVVTGEEIERERAKSADRQQRQTS